LKELKMILASAQTKPKQGDISANLTDHYQLIKIASDKGADLIVFPEMSITGYERERADELAFIENDHRLRELRKLSSDLKLIIITGAPIRINSELHIGSFIFLPEGSVSIYTKQFLHSGEAQYFKSSFNYNPVIEMGKERISFAICADIDNPVHPENAHKCDSTLYIPSIFFTISGIEEAYRGLSGYAKKYNMNILMSNYCGKVWGLDAGGGSAFWDKEGNLIETLDDSCKGLLIVKKNNNSWTGKTIKDK
jgi:predicted amidohydrolase